MKQFFGRLLGGVFTLTILLPLSASAQGFGDTTYVEGIGVAGARDGDNPGASDGLIQVIKNAINWALSILGLIALVLCLYAGFLITTAAGDDGKVKKGTGIIKNAAIGLAVIALSALIVNLIFYVIKGATG